MEIVVTVPASVSATLINDAKVSSDVPDPDNSNNLATTQTTVEGADIWIDKTSNFPTGNPSTTILYFLNVHNVAGCSVDDPEVCGNGGPSDAQNVVVTDTLPLTAKKMSVVFVSEDCVYDEAAHTVTCTTATLPARTSVLHEIHVQVKGRADLITNVATVSSSTPDPDTANNTDTLDTVVKGGSDRPGGPGGGRGRGQNQ